MKKYFVVSLPRTGTKSLCNMAHSCGYKFKHVPHFSFEDRLKEGYNFFSDTPCFVPSFIENLCKRTDFESHFIYIEKDYENIFKSWVKVNLYQNYVGMYRDYFDSEKKETMRYGMQYDIQSYNESFSNEFLTVDNHKLLFDQHKKKIFKIIKNYNKKILTYKFEDGWEPFCKFLESDVPSCEIPYINVNTMFEKII